MKNVSLNVLITLSIFLTGSLDSNAQEKKYNLYKQETGASNDPKDKVSVIFEDKNK